MAKKIAEVVVDKGETKPIEELTVGDTIRERVTSDGQQRAFTICNIIANYTDRNGKELYRLSLLPKFDKPLLPIYIFYGEKGTPVSV